MSTTKSKFNEKIEMEHLSVKDVKTTKFRKVANSFSLFFLNKSPSLMCMCEMECVPTGMSSRYIA